MSGHSTRGRWRISGKTNAVAVMGGCEMDLRRAELEGPEVEITAVAFWGGIDIIVPEGFDVELRGFSFMGGRDLKLRDVPIVPGSPRIVVRGFAVMGGIDVKSRPNRSAKRLGKGSTTDELAAADPVADPTATGRARKRHPARPSADGTVTILFCDMVDYAGMTERLGDQASREVLREHHRIVRDAIAPTRRPRNQACRATASWWRSAAWPAPCVVPSTSNAPSTPTFPPTTARNRRPHRRPHRGRDGRRR